MNGVGSLGSRWLVGGTALTLIASFVAPAVGGIPQAGAATPSGLSQVGPADAPSADAAPEVGELVPTTALKGEELAPSVLSFTQLTPARPGGEGRVRMSLVPEDASTDPMRKLVVVMKVAKGVRWGVPRVAGWTCDAQRSGTRLRCARTAAVGAGAALSMDLVLKVSGSRTMSTKKRGTARITGQASWRTGRGSVRKSWLETGSGTLEIQPALGVDLKVAGDGQLAVVSDADRGARAVQLLGRLSGVVGQQVRLRWRQVRGPAVEFVSDRTVTTDESRVSQTVLLPRGFDGNRTLVFELRATSGGQVVKDRATVRITSERLQGEVAPRNRLIAPALDQAPNGLKRLKQIPSPAKTRRLKGKVRLVGPKNGLARPGQDVVLKIKSSIRVKRVRWVTHTEAGGESTSLGGTRITVTTPEVGMGYLRVEAYVRLSRARTVVRSFTLLQKPSVRGPQPPIPDDDEKKNRARFCSLAKTLHEAKLAGDDTPVEVTTKDKSVLTIWPAKTNFSSSLFPTPGDCSPKGTIEFGKAKLKSSADAEFDRLEGTISVPDGIQVTRMTWTLDEAMYAWVPESVRTLQLEGKVTIGFDPKKPGEWDAVKGTSYLQPYSVADLSLTGIPFVPLPGGWTISAKDGAFLQFFKDEDKGVPEGSIQFVQKAVDPTSSANSSIQVSTIRKKGDDGTARWSQVVGAANNIEVFKTPAGETVMASGDVVFDIVQTDKSSNQLNLEITCASPKSSVVRTACPMGDDVYFKDGKLRLSLPRNGVPSTGGYLLSTKIAFGSASSEYVLKAEGAYTSKDSWRLAVKSDVTFDMGPGMSAVGFEGVIKRGKEKIDGQDKVVLTFDIATSMSMPEFANAVDVKKVSARLTNWCEKTEPDCQADEIRLKAGIDLAIPAPGGKTIDAALTGTFNWKTKGLVFRADVGSGTPLGPDGWNFQAGSIFASRAGYGYCQAQDAKDRAPNVWAVGFQGKGTLFGAATNLTMQFSKEGSCIWGSVGELATGGLPTNGVIGSWTSFPKGALVKVSDAESFKIKANTGSLKGKVDLPKAVDEFLGSTGQLAFTAEITGAFQGGLFEIAYTGKPANVTGQGANSFDLTKIALGMKWKVGNSAELYAGAEGLLTIKGDPAKQIADSVTPLGVYFAVAASNSGVSMSLTAGVAGTGPVQNAFGVQGLTLRELGVSAKFDLPPGKVQVKFAADATMPKAWEASGFKAGTPVRLAFSVGTAEPWCVDFQIGVQGSREVALDVANAGYLVAHYFRILIAPAGCTVPISASETRKIPPGYGFAFDGYIIGAPIVVALNVGFGTGVGSEFTMQGQLKMPKLELPLITLSGADGRGDLTVSLDIDTAKRKYDAAIDAGVVVGYPDWGFGTRVAIRAQLKTSDAREVIFQAWASSEVKITGAYMRMDPFTIDLAVPKGTLVPSRAKVSSRVEFGIFGVKMLSGEVDMAYDRGHLVQFGVLVGASLDIKVAKLTGNLAFRYCLGSIGGSQTRDGRLAACHPFQYKASARPGYRIDLGGILRVIGIKKSYYWNISEQSGGEGDPAFEPKQPPGPLPGPTADIKPDEQASSEFMLSPLNVIRLTLGTADVDFRSIRPADVQVPRESRTVKACSVVQVGTKPYRPEPGTYPNAEPLDPVPTGDCGLIGAYAPHVPKSHVRTVPIICSERECVADDKQFRSGGPSGSLREARDQILALLRQPPGVLPPGAEIYYDSDNRSDNPYTDQGALRGLQSTLRVAGVPNGKVFLELRPKHVHFPEFPSYKDKSVYYFLTDRGVLRSSVDGWDSVGTNAALDEAPPPKSQPVLALIGEKIVVYCGPTQASGILWTYGEAGYKKVKDCKPTA